MNTAVEMIFKAGNCMQQFKLTFIN